MLNKFNVNFDIENHEYTTQDGKFLSGITPVLGKFISPNKYDNVSEEVLRKACERGSLIHADISLYINGFDISTPEVERFKEKFGNENIHSECLVSDGENFASAIDVVKVLEDGSLYLYDIKTTYAVDKDYCRWQLSIYAHFCAMAGFDVVGASVLHFDKDRNLTEIPIMFVPEYHIIELLNAYISGNDWQNPFVGTEIAEATAREITMLEQSIQELKKQQEIAENKLRSFKTELLEKMESEGLFSIETPTLSVKIKEGYERTTIDTKALKSEYPDIAKKFEKTTQINRSLTIKLKTK